MAVHSKTVSFVVEPLSVIDISVSMDKSSLAVGFVVFPPSFIHGSVWPDLSTFTLSYFFADNPLSVVFGMVFKFNKGSVVHWVLPVVGFFVIVEFA